MVRKTVGLFLYLPSSDLLESLFVFLRELRNPADFWSTTLNKLIVVSCVYVWWSLIQNMARFYIHEGLRGTP